MLTKNAGKTALGQNCALQGVVSDAELGPERRPSGEVRRLCPRTRPGVSVARCRLLCLGRKVMAQEYSPGWRNRPAQGNSDWRSECIRLQQFSRACVHATIAAASPFVKPRLRTRFLNTRR